MEIATDTVKRRKPKSNFDSRFIARAKDVEGLKNSVENLQKQLDHLEKGKKGKRKGKGKRTRRKLTAAQLENRKAMLVDKIAKKKQYASETAAIKKQRLEFEKRMRKAQKERIKQNPHIGINGGAIDRFFSNIDNCYDFLEKILFPDGIVKCFHCKHAKCYRHKTRRRFTCASCKKQFSITTGTIFSRVRFGLTELFRLLRIENRTTNKLTIREVIIEFGVSAKTGMRRLHDIRHAAFSQIHSLIDVGSTVHIDTTGVIGQNRNRHDFDKLSRPQIHEYATQVIGIRQLNGPVILNVVADLKKDTMENQCLKYLRLCTIYTDGHASFANLGNIGGFRHDSVDHSIGENGRGKVNSNAAESTFMIAKKTLDAHQNCFKYVQLILNAIAHEKNATTYQLTLWEKFEKSVKTAMHVLKPKMKSVGKTKSFKLPELKSTILYIQPEIQLRKAA